MKRIILVEGMSCNHCVGSVTEALEAIGATDVRIDLDTKEVKFDLATTDTDIIVKAIDDIGFEVVEIK